MQGPSTTSRHSVLGSNVVASNGVSIAAGGDLTVGAVAATGPDDTVEPVSMAA